MKEEDKDEEDSNTESAKITIIRENNLTNIIKEFEIKEELYNIEVITIQALEVMIEKLVFDQVKEQEE